MKAKVIVCSVLAFAIVAAVLAAIVASTGGGAANAVARLLPADTVLYVRAASPGNSFDQVSKWPGIKDADVGQQLQGMENEFLGEISRELELSKDQLLDLRDSIRALHVAVLSFNLRGAPNVLCVAELARPDAVKEMLPRVMETATRQGAANAREMTVEGVTVYRLAREANFALSGNMLVFGTNESALAGFLAACKKKPEQTLADVATFKSLSSRYSGYDLFAFADGTRGWRMIRSMLRGSDLRDFEQVDSAFRFSDVKAAAIGSKLTTRTDEVATEITVLVDDTNPTRQAFKGTPINFAKTLKGMPQDAFLGILADSSDVTENWQKFRGLVRQIDDDLDREVERSRQKGYDLDDLFGSFDRSFGLYFVLPQPEGQYRKDPSVVMVASVREQAAAQKVFEAMSREVEAGVQKVGGFTVASRRYEATAVGPGYFMFGGNGDSALRAAIESIEGRTKADPELLRLFNKIGGKTATKALFLDPRALGSVEREFEPIAAMVQPGFRCIVTLHEEKNAIHLRSNVPIATLAGALWLMVYIHQPQRPIPVRPPSGRAEW